MQFVDTNLFIRHLTRNDPQKAQACFYALHPPLDFEDALAVAHMERLGIVELYSYDEDFEILGGIRRLEP